MENSQTEQANGLKTEPAEENRTPEELQAAIRTRADEIRKKSREASEAVSEGKGRLHLEKPIPVDDREISELPFDFMALTGLEYTDAMDSDINAQQSTKITYRQALAIFSKAASKEVSELDMRDIMERIGATDAVEAVQLAMRFLTASARAGWLRISKK